MLEDIAILTGADADHEGPRHRARQGRARPPRHGQEDRDRRRQHHDHRGRRRDQGHPGPHRADPPRDRRAPPATTTARSSRSASPSSPAAWPRSTSARPAEAELKEKKARVEDALHATRAAVAEGIVPGGGVSLHPRPQGRRSDQGVQGRLRQARATTTADDVGQCKYDFAAGIDVVYKALAVPLQTIADNAGEKGTVVVAKVAEGNGSALRLQRPDARVRRPAQGRASSPPRRSTAPRCRTPRSVATMLLAADCIITEKPKDKDDHARPRPRPRRRRHGWHGWHGRHGGLGMGGMGF